ncbi:patatin family protein [Blautia sp. 1033sp1_1033st1_G9_1033SCRN_220408]|uniref:patatin family protein n=1 Tax=Blautia sp. 1033sp1_1033st1_G9_1033SCRN_220408 TaxID=3144490 RepID=UPI0034A2F860
MNGKKEAALVLEGGGTRGVFTAGVLDYLMEKEVKFPYVIGVSAGACNAIDYVSKQIGRTKDCTIIQDRKNRYIGTKDALKKGYLFDMDRLFDEYPNRLFPFDFDTYFASDIQCEVVVTNCLTGEAMYLSEKQDRERLLTICRASSSIPLISPVVDVDGIPCVDGGVADSVPLIHSMKLGHQKNVVVLTRNKGYRKKAPGKSRLLYTAALKKYPNLLNALLNRYRNYNRVMELVEKWEEEGHIFVIRPEVEPVSRTEQNVDKLTEFYDHGYQLMKQRMEEMQAYLEK